ncbi:MULTISPECIES: AimR family lysis-lysogeny pheromone receptor [Bacillus amyloliquefaciens group]|uniref:AimR family lysis-lysogeny pheromone receptor n=1 Tax=Bacillus amyloliquefaciens group TaxID=1938374 RepID=UPI000F424C13|nr:MULTISPECIES: AimR family lysis-lysogeny pheromone receptor [Bacillus amyloliquefaciens group]AYV16453.1 XRE family transcriptional regulator [Bacillus velezensis]MEC5260780.1 AimR family lysis-lysogeny pheromone receptor [Bacillus amyloliquefaciens]RXJ44690.1 XRE family transcriptional regulator [Bacillus velezensis]
MSNAVKEKQDIRFILKEQLASSNKTQNGIAKTIGITKGYMSKFFSGKEIAFWMVIETVKQISPNDEKQLMKAYCESGIDKKYVYCALEYCYVNQMYDVMNYLILNYSHLTPEPCRAYRWLLEFRKSLEPFEHQRQLQNLSLESTEGKVLLKIFESYVNYNIGKYDLGLFAIDKAKKYLQNVNDPFLLKSFQARIDEVLANIYLKQENNINKARLAAKSLMQTGISQNHIMTATYLFALSFFLESYEKSFAFYKRLLMLYEKEHDREDEVIQNKEEIAILQFYWLNRIDSEYNVTQFTSDLRSHKPLENYYEDESLKPYAYLFDGIRQMRADKILLSLHFFSESRDYFRANIPKIQLQKMDLDLKI